MVEVTQIAFIFANQNLWLRHGKVRRKVVGMDR